LPLLHLEKELKLRFDALNAEKMERLDRLRLRSKVDQELCDALSMTPYYIPTGSVPNDRQLAELEEHIRSLENEQV
jgi:protein regulator of cytokinesis 1